MSITLLDRAAAASAIIALSDRAREVQTTIHQIGCSSIAHMRDHGDYRTATQLMNALPNGQRVQALAVWFREFTSGKFSVTFDNKDKTWKGSLKKDRKDADFRVDEAMEVSFADFTKERVPRTFTLPQLVAMLKSKADNTESNPDGTPKISEAARMAAGKVLAFMQESNLIPQI